MFRRQPLGQFLRGNSEGVHLHHRLGCGVVGNEHGFQLSLGQVCFQQGNQLVRVAVAIGVGHRLLQGSLRRRCLTQNGIHQRPGLRIFAIFFCQRHRFIHGGAFWDLVQLINLVQPQMEDVPHHGMEVFQPPRQELLQVKIQLVPVLQDAVAQPRSQRRVPWGQAVPGNIFFQRPVRPCAAFTAGDQRVQRRFSRAHQRSKG